MGNPGVKGGNNNKDGKNGLNKVVLVPVGTAFRNTHTRQIVAQLTQENQLFLAAKGGAGGKGNAYFKSAENQTPQVAEAGGEGESFELIVGKAAFRFINWHEQCASKKLQGLTCAIFL